MGLKTSDHHTLALCLACHDAFHKVNGAFSGWPKARLREWQLDMVARYRPAPETDTF